MQRLTKGEEEIMHHVWELERCTVRDVIERLGEPKPPHSSISSIFRILEAKGFLDHKAYGRTYEYFPIVKRDDYSKKSIKKLVSDYFGGSAKSLVSFLVKTEDVDIEELEELLAQMKDEEKE